jgi:hypothetical protein
VTRLREGLGGSLRRGKLRLRDCVRETLAWALLVALLVIAGAASPGAHSGPPFPIVQSQAAGRYDVAIWTDPDATDDATAGGQFWVVLTTRDGGGEVPAGTRVRVAVRALDREAPELTADAVPVDGAVGNQFAALRLDHEGRFAVRVAIDGPLGPAEVSGAVDATYDLRPAPILFLVYLAPFVIIGALWFKVLRKRRAVTSAPR